MRSRGKQSLEHANSKATERAQMSITLPKEHSRFTERYEIRPPGLVTWVEGCPRKNYLNDAYRRQGTCVCRSCDEEAPDAI